MHPTFDCTRPEVDQLAETLVRSIDFKRHDLGDVLAALQAATAFCLSLACPCCRASIARQLRRHIPQMLAEANALASAMDEPPEHQQHMH